MNSTWRLLNFQASWLMAFRSVNATARDFHGFTNQMSFARLVLSISCIEPMPSTFSSGLPAKTVAIASLNEFLNTYSTVYLTIPESALFGSLGAVFQNDGRYARAFDWWTIHLVLAITLATKSRNQRSDLYKQAVRHVNNALEYAESVLKPGSISGIQATLLLAIYSLVDPSHFSSWFLVGTASRMMVDLGIYQNAIISKVMLASPNNRQRICQCVYSLDRFDVPLANVISPTDKCLEHVVLQLSELYPSVTILFTPRSTEIPRISIQLRLYISQTTRLFQDQKFLFLFTSSD